VKRTRTPLKKRKTTVGSLIILMLYHSVLVEDFRDAKPDADENDYKEMDVRLISPPLTTTLSALNRTQFNS
jgi:hypothetical protein